jgi:hypothetical protein
MNAPINPLSGRRAALCDALNPHALVCIPAIEFLDAFREQKRQEV